MLISYCYDHVLLIAYMIMTLCSDSVTQHRDDDTNAPMPVSGDSHCTIWYRLITYYRLEGSSNRPRMWRMTVLPLGLSVEEMVCCSVVSNGSNTSNVTVDPSERRTLCLLSPFSLGVLWRLNVLWITVWRWPFLPHSRGGMYLQHADDNVAPRSNARYISTSLHIIQYKLTVCSTLVCKVGFGPRSYSSIHSHEPVSIESFHSEMNRSQISPAILPCCLNGEVWY